MQVLGFLSSRSPGESIEFVAAFRRGLSEMGFAEGRNAVIAFRWAEGAYDRLAALAAELVDTKVAVIVTAGGALSALAAKAATSTVPVVFTSASDPVEVGLVASLARPGGNVTGMATFSSELGSKRLGLLRELVPTASSLAMLSNPNYPLAETDRGEVRRAAQMLGLSFHALNAGDEPQLEAAFESMAQRHVGALIVGADPFFATRRRRIVELAARYAVPTSYVVREFVEAGGLMSYGTNLRDNYRKAGVYTGRVLRGEKPADLPVQLPTRFEMVINMKTAKALGLTVPNSMQLLADDIIE